MSGTRWGQRGGTMGTTRITGLTRAVGVLLAALLVLTVGASTAGAGVDGAGGRRLAVSGSFTATGNFESTTECPSFHTWHDGSGEWTGLGAVTFNLDYCVELNLSGASPLSGTFTITSPDGTLTGDLVGELPVSTGVPGDTEAFPANYTLTVTGGTGRFARATGTLSFAAFWDDPQVPVFSMHGT